MTTSNPCLPECTGLGLRSPDVLDCIKDDIQTCPDSYLNTGSCCLDQRWIIGLAAGGGGLIVVVLLAVTIWLGHYRAKSRSVKQDGVVNEGFVPSTKSAPATLDLSQTTLKKTQTLNKYTPEGAGVPSSERPHAELPTPPGLHTFPKSSVNFPANGLVHPSTAAALQAQASRQVPSDPEAPLQTSTHKGMQPDKGSSLHRRPSQTVPWVNSVVYDDVVPRQFPDDPDMQGDALEDLYPAMVPIDDLENFYYQFNPIEPDPGNKSSTPGAVNQDLGESEGPLGLPRQPSSGRRQSQSPGLNAQDMDAKMVTLMSTIEEEARRESSTLDIESAALRDGDFQANLGHINPKVDYSIKRPQFTKDYIQQ